MCRDAHPQLRHLTALRLRYIAILPLENQMLADQICRSHAYSMKYSPFGSGNLLHEF